MGAGDFIEVVLPEAPLKVAMIRYGLNVLGLSVIISVITAALVYFALNGLLVQPMMRIARNMLRFSQNPEDASRIIVPTPRRDEIGTAERELAHMQGELTQTLQQKSRLAALGLAVSKINHDLRNMLANAQLISDRLSSLPDPAVQRFAPKLIASLGRAINLADSTLKFGRAEEAPPRRELMPLRPLVEEVGDGLGLPREGAVDWTIDMDDALRVDADRDQLFRVLSNLTRNALQAIEQQDNVGGHIRVVGAAQRQAGHHRGERRWTGRAGEGARPPVPGVPGLGAQGRDGPRARRGAGAGERAWRHHPAARHRQGRDLRARDPRPRRVRGPCEIRSTPSSTWPSSAAASTAAASPATRPAAACRCSCARWAISPAAPPRAPPS